MLGPSRRSPLPASTSLLNSTCRATYAEQDRTEPSEEWKLELKVKIEAALEEIFKEAKGSPVKEPGVKIAVFVVQIEGNKALAHRQYESNLEQGHLQLPTPISRPLSIMSEPPSSFQQYQQPNSQLASLRQSSGNASPDTTSVRHSHYRITRLPLVEEPESESEIPLNLSHPGRALIDIHDPPPSNVGVSLSSHCYYDATRLPLVEESESGPEILKPSHPRRAVINSLHSPSTAGVSLSSHNQYTVTRLLLVEESESESEISFQPPHPGRAVTIHNSPPSPSTVGVSLPSLPRSCELAMAPEGEATGSSGPVPPSATSPPSRPGYESQSRTVPNNERDRCKAANRQRYSMDSTSAFQPLWSVTADHRSLTSASANTTEAAAARISLSVSPPIPIPSGTKPSISLRNLEREGRPTENSASRSFGLLSATRPAGPMLKR
jgi:hypothetical protein